jgi:KUP system potassium uptake protein
MMTTSFFISHEVIVSATNLGMANWRKRLFTTMAKNAMNAAEYFNIPANRVIEMGTRIEI